MESSLDTPGVQISYSCTPTQPCSASPSSIEVSTVLLAFEQVAVRPCRHILNHIYNQKKNRKEKAKGRRSPATISRGLQSSSTLKGSQYGSVSTPD
ncbi:hypothetical protein ES288_D04G152400v1 [Gossypium darwinii]|uniref:Uncharacterized protein n=1 Tax=Gossypium darwinii TaxID=34276 RepID=A0A5D2CZL1_GOSDA|nr:hypothetical protein ES288_D04G152400v1 [Gossypium darwinii]